MCVDIIDLLLHCKGSLDSGNYKGVKLVFGQEITCDKLVMVPSYTITSSPAISESEDVFSVFDVVGVSGKVATGICITKSSLTANISSCLVIYPPRSKGVKPVPQAKHDEEVRVQKFRFAIVSPSTKLLIAQHILDASSIMASGERSTLLKSDVLIGTRQYSNPINRLKVWLN
ncbi:Rab escort protein 1 [Tanacetum coccineum]